MHSLGIDIGGSSVKAAGVRDGKLLWATRSSLYARPSLTRLKKAIREAAGGRVEGVEAVGLCVPGPLDAARRCVSISVNVPDLVGARLSELLSDALGVFVSDAAPGAPHAPTTDHPDPPFVPLTILTDARAAAHDLYTSRRLTGRLLALVLGTGVGAAVLDESGPAHVDGDSPGHFGQLDVSLESTPADPPVGPDGGAGGLEAYLGAAALRRAYGSAAADLPSRIRVDDPPARALARAIRIAHAIYRPHHVILAGGVGARLGHLVEPLRLLVNTNLTNIARPNWTLTTADHDFHAAAGAAGLAARSTFLGATGP